MEDNNHEEAMPATFYGFATRRESTASATSATSALSSVVGNGSMSESEQEFRRRQIKEIMNDTKLTPKEKSLAIQTMMDGRRRGSMASRRSSNCSQLSAHSCSSDMDGDAVMGEAANHAMLCGYGYRHTDERSIASSVTSFSDHEDDEHQNSHSSTTQRSSTPSNTPYLQYHGRSHSLQDWNDTDRIHAAAQFNALPSNARLMEQSRPPCDHYERKCTFVSPCCGLAFGCRICHDDCPHLPPPIRQKPIQEETAASSSNVAHLSKVERRRSMPAALDGDDDEEPHHLIDRFAVTEVICRDCYTRQSSKTNICINCGVQFGDYHCNICNLWMSNKESPYHCVDCGFCRVGGSENFRHCHDCGMCIDALLFSNHNCKSGKYMNDCPICREDLFSSRFASHEMPCGHAIHWHCFKQLTSYDTRCPVCKKTAESPEQMAATWSAIAMGIALQPVPSDMARVVNIICNDCESTDSNRRWHFLGVRCLHCLSFNTQVEQIVMHGIDAADFLDELEVSQSNGVPTNISMPLEAAPTVGNSSIGNTGGDPPRVQGMSGASPNDAMDLL